MIKTLLKFIFAFGIVYWLVKQGNLDFSLIMKLSDYKLNATITILILFFHNIMTALRWKILLEIKSSKTIKMFDGIRLTWIGIFFNTVLPGAVTGDIIKILYAKDLDPKLDRSFLLSSIFADRLFGLIGLMSLLGVSSIINYNELISISPKLKNLIHFNFLIFGGILSLLATFFIPKKIQNYILKLIKFIPVINKKLAKLVQQVWLIGSDKKTVLKCFFISSFTQTFYIYSFWNIISPFITVDISLSKIYSFIPLGLATTAIPISPAGLGVGHAAFDKLFSLFQINGGASYFNIFFIFLVCINLTGIIPYLLSGKKHNIDEAEMEAEQLAN